MADTERRRRRTRRAGTPAPERMPMPGQAASAHSAAVHDPEPEPGDRRPADRAPAERSWLEDRETERGLRGLIGAGASQVSLTAALRARDAARPNAAELAAAETDLMIVRRGWVPRDPLTR